MVKHKVIFYPCLVERGAPRTKSAVSGEANGAAVRESKPVREQRGNRAEAQRIRSDDGIASSAEAGYILFSHIFVSSTFNSII